MSNNEPYSFSGHAPLDLDYPCILGMNVERMRKRARITKTRFALMVGIGRPFLNKIENGTSNPQLDVIVRLAEALETTPQALLTNPFDHQAAQQISENSKQRD